MNDVAPELTAALRGGGLRVTQPRLAVLAAVREHPHSDALSVLGHVRETLPAVSHQAVYDCLTALAAAGLLRRIEPAGSPARYEWGSGDNHHHLICRGCGAITDVECGIGAAPCLTVADDHGYVIDEAEVIYWGLCPECHLKSVESQSK